MIEAVLSMNKWLAKADASNVTQELRQPCKQADLCSIEAWPSRAKSCREALYLCAACCSFNRLAIGFQKAFHNKGIVSYRLVVSTAMPFYHL